MTSSKRDWPTQEDLKTFKSQLVQSLPMSSMQDKVEEQYQEMERTPKTFRNDLLYMANFRCKHKLHRPLIDDGTTYNTLISPLTNFHTTTLAGKEMVDEIIRAVLHEHGMTWAAGD